MRITIIGIITAMLLTVYNSYALDINADESILAQNIIESLRSEPDKWFITSDKLVYTENKRDIKTIKKSLYPEYENKSTFVLSYYFTQSNSHQWISIKKPVMGIIKNDKAEEILLRKIKIFLINSLQKELKIKKTTNIPVEKEQTPLTENTEESSLKKL